ncbi:MAG: branched-chain amino acid ABC transporter permease [Alphaproteobacteria bacterium]
MYGLLAIAFSLIYRSTRAINFAQGHLALLGAYVALWAISGLKLPYLLSCSIGVVAVIAISVLIEMVAFRPLYRFGTVLVIVSSIALTFVLETIVQLIWGAQSLRLPPLVGGNFSIGAVVVSWQQVAIICSLVVMVVVLQLLLRTRIGRAMRATAENPDVASLVGIRSRFMISFSFGFAGLLTGIAGILVAPLTYLEPSGGGSLGLLGIVAAIVGGLGNIFGAVAGGMIIGFVHVTGAYLAGGSFVEILTFAVLVLVLLVRPQGIFGEEGTKVRA